jgi:pimeloyl-ACP methyl ester carboxylesterase
MSALDFMAGRAPRLLGRRVAAVALCVALAGCTLIKLKEDADAFYASTVLVGRVDNAAGTNSPLIVAAYTGKSGRIEIAHHTLLHEAGGYELIVPKGEYALFAFADLNDNRIYDAGEPAGAYAGATIVADGTGVVAGLDFVIDQIPLRKPAIAPGTAFSARHSTQAGALADLDLPIFAAANGSRGYWAPMEFFKEAGGNIYFLEPYDPSKIPILFVHGAAGSPQDWRYLFDHIDRSRYQPWFFYYPSGSALDSMAYLLYWKLLNLQLRYRFDRLYLTAHSMGGLVVRTFLLNHGAQFPQATLFVSLSTPWAGEATAELGVKHSPAVVPSWNDMQPQGRFLQALFARKLPPTVDYYLLFGHKGGYSLLRPNNDGTVTLASQLRNPAQAEAKMVYGFDEDHVSILSSPQVVAQYLAILASAEKQADAGPQPGAVHVNFAFDNVDGPTGLPTLLLTPADAASAREPTAIALSLEDNGRKIGPIPAGTYDAALVAAAYRTEPRRLRIRVDADKTPVVSFRLTPQGTLGGYVGVEMSATDNPAGSYRPPHETVRINSITLSGAGVQRSLVPRRSGSDNVVDRYLDGRDDAYGAFFSFVDLPAGDYQLTIVADGYRPHTSSHTVVPGQPGRLSPIVLTPLR